MVNSGVTKKSLGNWVLNLGVFFLLASWVATVVVVREDRHLEVERARKITHNLAQVLESHISGTFLRLEGSLSLLRNAWETDNSVEKINRLFKGFISSRQDLFNLISVIGPDGNVVVTSQDEFTPTYSGDRLFFKFHETNPGRELLIGGPIAGRVTRKWYLPVSVRLNDSDGKFAGVLLASVNPYFFSMIFKEVALGDESLVLLTDREGTVYSGIQNGKDLDLGFEIAPEKLTGIFCDDIDGLEIAESLADGVKRFRGRAFVQDRSMAVSVETGYNEWLAQSRARSFFLLTLQALLSLFVIAVILRLRRAVELREEISLELDRFFSSTIDLLCIVDKHWRFVRVNAAWENTLGYGEERLKRHKFIDFVHPDDVNQFEGLFAGLNAQKFEQDFTGRYLHCDGSYRWLEWKLSLQGDFFYASARDITEKREVENALKNSELRFQTFMDMSPVYGYIKDDTLRHIYKNHCVTALVDVDKTGLPDSARSFLSDNIAQMVEEADQKILAGTEKRIELEYSFEIGTETHWVKDVKFRIDLPDGRPAVGGLAFNITGQKRSEEERIKLQKLEGIGTLAGGIAHDFNNLLMAIFGNITVARMEFSAEHPAQKPLCEAENALERATALTRQLLTFARGGAPIKHVTDIGKLVQEAVKFDLAGSMVQPVFDLPSGLWKADVDRGQIQQVIANLVVNSVQAMEKGGRVFVKLENVEFQEDCSVSLKPGKYVRFTFRDEGMGIAPEHMGQVFDPYFTTKERGSGLGLATSHSIIKKHGGHIDVESETSRGTTFIIYLPAADDSVEPETVTTKGHDSAKKVATANILVLDDEDFIRRLVIEIFQRQGYSVHAVADGTEAVAAFKKAAAGPHPFDLVIMDLTIPGGMGGKEAVKEILEVDPKARCIVSSGYSNDPVMANYASYGFKGVAEKPYSIESLLAVVAKALEDR